MYRARKLKIRRQAKQRKKQVEDISSSASKNFDKHFSNRLLRLLHVRRFVAGWLLLIFLLSTVAVLQTRSLAGYYQHVQPVAGGTYTEGINGALTNVNPLFTSGVVDATVSRLLFSGLLTYDEENNLVGDLAESWSTDEKGTTYTITLKDNLKWHDGARLTAEDVVFTFTSAQNADVRSPLAGTWKDISIKAVDERTVTFTLKAVFAPFEQALTTGILPAHILRNISPAQLRSSTFNTVSPVGSGPYVWDTIEVSGNRPEDRQQNIGLSPYDNYHFGRPNIERYVLKTFVDKDSLLEAYLEQRVDVMVGLDQVPEEVQENSYIYETPTTAINFAFFNLKEGALQDLEVRKALIQAANKKAIYEALGYPVITADSPLLRSSFAYDPTVVQNLKQDIPQAEKLLTDAKYQLNEDGFRIKGEDELTIRMIGKNTYENNIVSKELQQNWSSLGIKVEVILHEDQDFQAALTERGYDVLLNSISIGNGPDVYAFWHSSQQDVRTPRLNFSNYSNEEVDTALDTGRTRLDERLRKAKYKTFLQLWVADAPALALYQPRFLVISRAKIFDYNPQVINISVDRLNNVHEWKIRQDLVPILE